MSFFPQLGLSPLLFCLDVPSPTPEGSKEMPVTLELTAPPVETLRDVQIKPNIRLCVLEKGAVGFGFNLGCVQQKPGTFVSQVQ